jgi:hypothetical protein
VAIRAFASPVTNELDRRIAGATEMERLFVEVDSYETRLIARGRDAASTGRWISPCGTPDAPERGGI